MKTILVVLSLFALNAHAASTQGTISVQLDEVELMAFVNGPAAATLEAAFETKGSPKPVQIGIRCFGDDEFSRQVITDPNQPLELPGLKGTATHCAIMKIIRH